MNYSKIQKYDATNWDGINTTIFFSGCKFHCPGCFNADIWDFDAGKKFTEETIDEFINYARDKHVTGICILGGEPFQQDLDMLEHFIKELFHVVRKPIHMWSGYKFEDLMARKQTRNILQYIDTLVDGQFEIDKKDITLKHRGSSNQRVINVLMSFLEGCTILWED